jgi:hypothetical protein
MKGMPARIGAVPVTLTNLLPSGNRVMSLYDLGLGLAQRQVNKTFNLGPRGVRGNWNVANTANGSWRFEIGENAVKYTERKKRPDRVFAKVMPLIKPSEGSAEYRFEIPIDSEFLTFYGYPWPQLQADVFAQDPKSVRCDPPPPSNAGGKLLQTAQRSFAP